jgi:hypothetical protein
MQNRREISVSSYSIMINPMIFTRTRMWECLT